MIRHYHMKDLERVQQIFSQQNFEYQMPDPSSFVENIVLSDENDVVVMGVSAVPTADIYFLCDSTWQTPGIRMEGFKHLHESMRRKLKERQIIYGHAWLPPQLEKSLGRRLMKDFGWTRPLWPVFARKVE